MSGTTAKSTSRPKVKTGASEKVGATETPDKFVAELRCTDESPLKVIRIVETFGPIRREDNEIARRIMRSVIRELRSSGATAKYLIAAGGFLQCNWPRNLQVRDQYRPQSSDLRRLRSQGKEAGDVFLREFALKLLDITRYISFGIDCSDGNGRSAELIYFRDLETNAVHITGKSYPIGAQEKELVCFDLQSHFKKPYGDKVLLLGCHDMNLFNNRARKNAKPGGYRSKAIRKMRRIAKKFDPTVLLQHPHSTDSANVWKGAMGTALKELKSLSTFASAGRYYWGKGGQRMKLEPCLKGTAKGSVATVVVSKHGD